jgi:hypothetical protein
VNYAGKFDAKVSVDGPGLHSPGHVRVETVHATQVPADAIVVEDAHLLFNAQFKRSGVDLVLSKDDSELVLHDYFKGEKRATLASPDGAHLTGDLVSALAGNVQYAQATDGNAGAGKVIGHVSKLAGTATAIRNGVSVTLHNGDNVEKGDVVESGASSTLGITFIDGTVFGLSSNARMVLNEMVYDPNGSNNSSLLSLVAGTIAFIAGETAKHGDMRVDTPVATMGIRGTAVLCEIDFLVPGQGTPDVKFQVLVEPDGTTGSYILFDKTTLAPLAVVDTAGTQINISNGILSQTSAPLSPDVQQLISDIFGLKFSGSLDPGSFDHHTDTPVPLSLAPIKLADGSTATPIILKFDNAPVGGGNNIAGNSPSSQNGMTNAEIVHIDMPPAIAVAGGAAFTVRSGASQATAIDSVSGTVRFADINAGDLPIVSTKFVSFKLLDIRHNDISSTLTPAQLAQIAAVEAELVVTPSSGNNNNGSASWTYSVADSAFNFLIDGETLVLTYNATVDNNFRPNEQTASASFTITISTPNAIEWIHPTSGLWSVGSNWSAGSVPTASDDVIIPAQNIPGGSGLYDVTIAAPAFARNLTLNANGTTGAQVTNDSTLTVGQMLTIFNDGVLNNSGTVTVGKLELFDQSLLQNSGLITLEQGGDFTQSRTITNSGMIELAGGTLNVQTGIDNAGGTIQVDDGALLKLNGVAIQDGKLIVAGGGTLDVEGVLGASLDGVMVLGTNHPSSTIEIGATTSGSILTLDHGTTVTGGALLIAGGSALDVESSGGATLDGVAVSSAGAAGMIEVGAMAGNATLLLDHGTSITAGTLQIASFSTLDVESPLGATLNGVAVLGASGSTPSTIDIGANTPSGSILTLDDGTAITNGDLSIAGGSALDVESPLGATLDGVKVSGTNDFPTSMIEIGVNTPGASSLMLDDATTIANGTVTIAGGSTLDIESPLGATWDGVTVWGTDGPPASTIEIGVHTPSGSILEICDHTTIMNGNLAIAGGSALDIESVPNTEVLDGVTVTGVSPASMIEVGVNTPGGSSLTLVDGTSIANVTVTLASGSVVDIESPLGAIFDGVMVSGNSGPPTSTIEIGNITPSGSILTLDDATTITNGTLTIAGGSTLDIESTGGATLDGVMVDTAGGASMIGIGANTPGGSILTLDDGTTIQGGTLTIAGGSTLDIESTGGATLDGVTVLGVTGTTGGTFGTSGGSISTLHGAGLAGVVSSPGSTIEIGADTASGSILTLDDGTSIQAGMLTIAGGSALDAGIGGATLDGVTVSGANGPTQSMIEIGVSTPSGSILTLDDNTFVTNIALVIADHSALDIESTGGATLAGVAVAGVASGPGSMIEIGANTDNGSMLVLADATTLANVALTVTGGSTLNVEVASTASTFTGTSTLDNAGTIDSNGAADLSGLSSFTNDGFVEVVSGNLKIGSATGISGTGIFQIDAGATLEFTSGVSSGQTVTFNSTTGTLKLDQAENFNGVVSGFSTADGTLAHSDQIDLADINHHSASFQEQFDPATDTLTVTDGANTAVIQFTGSVGPLKFVDDGNPVNGVAGTSGTIVFDPPTTDEGAGAVIAHDPGPASNTVLAIAPNQTLTGSAAGDTFVFNFAAIGHGTVTDFHPGADTLQFSNLIFANVQAALSATHDDGHGNSVITIDSHDAITLSGVLKAQLHAADFHVM